jgi:competence protein ComK
MFNYEINAETLVIVPYANGKSKVYEYDGEYIINAVSLDIIKNSCLFFGCSFEGRRDAVKDILGIDMKVPILVEDSKNIIFFPISSCINKNSIWISYQNLLKYSKFDEFSTVLYFRNNKQVIVDVKYNLVDNQVIRCIKLESMLERRKNFIKREGIIIEEKNTF